jgi:hypothetical protein
VVLQKNDVVTLKEALALLEEWELQLEGEYGSGRTLEELEAENLRNPTVLKVKALVAALENN